MTIVTELPSKVKQSTTSPASFVRCSGCFCWRKPNHFVWVPPGLIDESSFIVCIKCALAIRHAFAVRNQKTVGDVAAIVANTINYGELGESVE